MNECFACESPFNPIEAATLGVPLAFAETYCSPECYKEFNSFLESQVSLAREGNIEPLATSQEAIAGVAKTLTQFIRARSAEQAQAQDQKQKEEEKE